ncbi:MAG: leucine-rich repeat protein, partial [Lachnospiraceae bacterium]|nr:leucine-rich repeat protein [Lachnospiraceae bacterium]
YIELTGGGGLSDVKYDDYAFAGAGLESVYVNGDFQFPQQLGESIFGDNYDVTVYSHTTEGIIAPYCAAYDGGDHPIRFVAITPLEQFAYEVVNDDEIKIKKYLGSETNVVVHAMIENKRVTAIGDAAFEGTNVVTLSLPAYVSYIGSYAFRNATSLSELYVNSDPSIGLNLFDNCNPAIIVYGITASELDEYCEEIGVTFNLGTTWGCFTYESSTLVYSGTTYNGVAITGLNDHVCNSSHKHLIIPAVINGRDVIEIAAGAFSPIRHQTEENVQESSESESVSMPNSVVKIGGGAFNCASLKVLRFQGTTMQEIEDDAFSSYYGWSYTFGDNSARVVYAAEIGSDAIKRFCAEKNIPYIAVATYIENDLDTELEIAELGGGYAITSLRTTKTNIVLPDTIKGRKVTEISKFAFQGAEFASLKVGQYVTKIGEHAFNDCVNLTVVDLPDGLKIIADGAFNGCTSLSSIFVPASVTTVGDMAFADCTALRNLRFLGDVRNIGERLIEGIAVKYGLNKTVSFLQVRKDATNLISYFLDAYKIAVT